VVHRPLVPPSEVVAADGRVPGTRGLATRRRLLDATAEHLAAVGYRELRVVEIARLAGTSPATFYQYFPDVDAALLALAANLAEAGGRKLRNLVAEADWDRDPEAAAAVVADGILAFWDRNREIVRVIDHAALEGDERFRKLRTWLLNGVYVALTDVLARADARGHARLDPQAGAGILVSMLSHVAAHRGGLVESGIDDAALRDNLRRVLVWAAGVPDPR
jgi:AcrR family transcriptional regulator